MKALRISLILLVCLGSCLSRLHADERDKDILLKRLRPVLKPVGSARLYYAGLCRGGMPSAPFAKLKLRSPTKGKTGLAAVREIFAENKHVRVTQSRSGIIRINVGDVPSDLLQTKIAMLRFNPDQQYTEELALIAIQSAREVEVAMRKHGFEHPVVVTSIMVLGPAPGRPHLPKRITNVTLDQALDLVAKTFEGIVTYEECRTPKGKGSFYAEIDCIVCTAN